MLKIYTDVQRYEPNKPVRSITPILKYYWEGVPEDQRQRYAGNPNAPYQIVPTPEEADYYMISRSWGSYFYAGELPLLDAELEKARQVGKKAIVWSYGDLEPKLSHEHVIVFTHALRRSKLRQNRFIIPDFIDDPLKKYRGGLLEIRQKGAKPVVGFCGHAGGSLLKHAYSMAWNASYRLRARVGRYPYDDVPLLVPAVLLRNRILRVLKRSQQVETDFIIRSQQRAHDRHGVVESDKVKTFYNNLFGTDYTVCVRGFGNWSIRFYETLACGRIPLFVDTDCVLPFDFVINWKDYCVWVEQHEIPHIAEKLADFHHSLSPDEFVDRQRACRQLWEDRLSVVGFSLHFPEFFEQIKLTETKR